MIRDLRPLVPRNATNGISRAEAHRDEIYGWFEELSQAEGVETLLVKSPPFNPTVWVAVEAWLPIDSPGMTKRARVEIELSPRDFCRWPIELKVVLKEPSRTRTYSGVVDFSRDHAAALLRYLLGHLPQAEFGFKYCRVAPFQLWRPRNAPVGLKADIIGRLPLLLLLFAAVGFLVAVPDGQPGPVFLVHLITGAAIVGGTMYLLDISALRAWQHLVGARASATPGANPTAAATLDVAARRDVMGVIALAALLLLSLFLLDRQANQVVYIGLATIVGILNFFRRRLIWTSGRPEAEPRTLLRMDSWQALLIGLGAERDVIHDSVVVELKSNADASWVIGDERIWYWGVDGKEERQQTVVSFRSALAFLHFNAYGSDLYAAWDAHINRGIWTEKRVASGTSSETGALCEVHTIASAGRTVSEYDVSDANCLLERVHAVFVRVLRRKLDEHQLDQEIDFSIVRERRAELTGIRAEDRDHGPRLSLAGFRRKA